MLPSTFFFLMQILIYSTQTFERNIVKCQCDVSLEITRASPVIIKYFSLQLIKLKYSQHSFYQMPQTLDTRTHVSKMPYSLNMISALVYNSSLHLHPGSGVKCIISVSTDCRLLQIIVFTMQLRTRQQ